MIFNKPQSQRPLHQVVLSADLVVVGGGLAGTCCALTAARQGIEVVLVQDRPVLGGNASSEVRLWALGATSHMGNNNRWAREGGVIDELVVENLYRNPEGNALIFDTVLLEKVWAEPNITLLLNTAAFSTQKSTGDVISEVLAFCSQNSTEYKITAPLFCDASGDGIIAFQSGAAFRMGAEAAEEFGEPFAPSQEYGELLGHSIYFMSKDVGRPVTYVPPAFALKDITTVPRYRNFSVKDQACWMWWIEYGGRLDTVHETETIKWELWKVVYGVWDYIKNSGNFPEAANLTLEWVGHIPGKRESRRFEGYHMLTQGDIVQQRHFEDTVSFGGWAIDIHPADGVYSEKPGCNQWHSKGIYEIPYRCLISKNIPNLFLAGRIISASHLAFGSTRVMMTCAHSAQAVGMAAALCIKNNHTPEVWMQPEHITTLQQELLKTGQHIPHVALKGDENFSLAASSTLSLSELSFDGPWIPLTFSAAQLVPLRSGRVPVFEVSLKVRKDTTLTVSLRGSTKAHNYTPEITLSEQVMELKAGTQYLEVDHRVDLTVDAYYFLCFHQNEDVAIKGSETRITGLTSAYNKMNKAVSNYGRQDPDPGIGFDVFEFWTPERQGKNIAFSIYPALECFGVDNLTNGIHRPYLSANAWVADLNDQHPELKLHWTKPEILKKLHLYFDTDFDHPMETSIWGHPQRVVPYVVRDYQVLDEHGQLLYEMQGNYQTQNSICLESEVVTSKIIIRVEHPSNRVPAAVFGVRTN